MVMVAQQSIEGDCTQQSQRAPMPGRSTFSCSLAMRSPPIAAGHLGGDSTLVQKDQAARIDLSYLLPPRLPPLSTFFRVLLLGVERFFFAP
jgi:hypothetical protein